MAPFDTDCLKQFIIAAGRALFTAINDDHRCVGGIFILVNIIILPAGTRGNPVKLSDRFRGYGAPISISGTFAVAHQR